MNIESGREHESKFSLTKVQREQLDFIAANADKFPIADIDENGWALSPGNFFYNPETNELQALFEQSTDPSLGLFTSAPEVSFINSFYIQRTPNDAYYIAFSKVINPYQAIVGRYGVESIRRINAHCEIRGQQIVDPRATTSINNTVIAIELQEGYVTFEDDVVRFGRLEVEYLTGFIQEIYQNARNYSQ